MNEKLNKIFFSDFKATSWQTVAVLLKDKKLKQINHKCRYCILYHYKYKPLYIFQVFYEAQSPLVSFYMYISL